VRVLTNSLAATDLPLVHGGYTVYREALLKAGVELHEMRAHPHRSGRWHWPWRGRVSLHSKTLIFDEHSAFVGSFNMDPRSAFWNTEIGVLLESPVLACQLKTLADQAMSADISYRLHLDDHNRLMWHCQGPQGLKVWRTEMSSPWRRFLSWFSARFAPSSWL
jgi:cardiolipin synthase C